MLSQNIKKLRSEKQMTQKDLAEILHVTPQAVSRWENDEVEPSISSIKEMAEIFNVSVDEILDTPVKHESQNSYETETAVTAQAIASCELCDKPLYSEDKIVRKPDDPSNPDSTTKCYCKDCSKKQAEQRNANVARKHSFIFSSLISATILFAWLIYRLQSKNADLIITLSSIGIALTAFTFSSCLFLNNNFIEDLFISISTWSIKFPGLIFSFDLDGIKWLIGMKLLFWVIGVRIGILAFLLALAICLPLSLFVYPFALYKNVADSKPSETAIEQEA